MGQITLEARHFKTSSLLLLLYFCCYLFVLNEKHTVGQQRWRDFITMTVMSFRIVLSAKRILIIWQEFKEIRYVSSLWKLLLFTSIYGFYYKPCLNLERLEQLMSSSWNRSASMCAYILAACLRMLSLSIHKGALIVIHHPVSTDLDCFPCLIDDEVKQVRSIHSLSGALSLVWGTP